MLLDGSSDAAFNPSPTLLNSNVVGISLAASIAKVGAHLSLYSSNPLNLFSSIHVCTLPNVKATACGPIYVIGKGQVFFCKGL